MLRRVTGVDLLEDLSEFFRSFGDMSEGFERRAREVNALLADGTRTTFVVVATPSPEAVDEAIFFRRRLGESDMPFGAAVVNRVHELEGGGGAAGGGGAKVGDDGVEAELAEHLGPALARRVARNAADWRKLVDRDRAGLRRLAAELDGEPLVRVPDLDDDVHDLAGLARVNEHLFGAGGSSPRIAGGGAPARLIPAPPRRPRRSRRPRR